MWMITVATMHERLRKGMMSKGLVGTGWGAGHSNNNYPPSLFWTCVIAWDKSLDVAYEKDRDNAAADTASSADLAAGPQQPNRSSVTFFVVTPELGFLKSVIPFVTFVNLYNSLKDLFMCKPFCFLLEIIIMLFMPLRASRDRLMTGETRGFLCQLCKYTRSNWYTTLLDHNHESWEWTHEQRRWWIMQKKRCGKLFVALPR